MLDRFSGRPTCLRGPALPTPREQGIILDNHQRRLAAFDRLSSAAAEQGIGTNSGIALNIYATPDATVALIAQSGDKWSALAVCMRNLREALPLLSLAEFGFQDLLEDPLSGPSLHLSHIGGGVEAWAFQASEGSVYKFFRPLENQQIGATFRFQPGDDSLLQAQSIPGTYRNLLEKLMLIHALGGMPTEVVAITPEGILVAKQTLGQRLPDDTDASQLLPPHLIPIPSRFLRCDRDHPRLAFVDHSPWLIADLHNRNIVHDQNQTPRIIDLVATPFASDPIANFPMIQDWLNRVRLDPAAGLLDEPRDEDL